MFEKLKKNKKSALIVLLSLVLAFSIGFADGKDKKPVNDKLVKDLEILLEKEIITSEQLVAIKDYLKIEREEKRKAFEQMKNMSEEERKDFIKDYRKTKVNVVDKMIEDNVINEEQGEELRKIMPVRKKRKIKNQEN